MTVGSSPCGQACRDQKAGSDHRAAELSDKSIFQFLCGPQPSVRKPNHRLRSKKITYDNPTNEFLKSSDIDIADTGSSTPSSTTREPGVLSHHEGRPGHMDFSSRRPMIKTPNTGRHRAGAPEEERTPSRSSGGLPVFLISLDLQS